MVGSKKKCSKDEILRKGYSYKKNNKIIKVKPSCIKKLSMTEGKRIDRDMKIIKQKKKIQESKTMGR